MPAGLARFIRGALLALALGGASSLSGAADAQRGGELYLGRQLLQVLDEAGRAKPLPQAACVQCHRRSGLGSFEGALAAPPIAGRLLFQPYDRDTGGFFRDQRRDRVRPAYDEAALHALLSTGMAPDGRRMRAPMPRYAIAEADAADLAAYLRTLASAAVPGLDAETIHLATVIAPESDPREAAAIEAVTARFVELKNAQSRHDAQRARQSQRAHEMAMNGKFRRWHLSVWRLQGDAATWAAQLERLDAQQPVYALVGGLGVGEWSPVHRFCERRHIPCLLPLLDDLPEAPAADDFYTLYFHRGRSQDLALAAQALREAGVRSVRLWSGQAPSEREIATIARAGLVLAGEGEASDGVLSLLGPAEHLARSEAAAEVPVLAWAPGRRPVTASQWAAAAAPLRRGVFVTPYRRAGADGATAWPRAEAWVRQQRLDALPVDVAAATLQALTTLGDALVHVDFDFTPDYVLELLEHGLENMIGYGPYDRLALGPGQRVAAKGSHVADVAQGRVRGWTWRLMPPPDVAVDQNREITATEASARPVR